MQLKALDPFHKQDLDNELHPSIYVEHQNYNLLILRFPIDTMEDEITVVSKGIIIQNNNIFIYERERQKLVPLELGWQSLYELLNVNINTTMRLINNLHEQIIDMEEILYAEKLTKEFLGSWFKIKKNLIIVNRILLRTIMAYEKFYEKHEQNITPLLNNFHDLLEHLTRSQRYVEHDIEKLTTIYSFYSARSNDKMNFSIYILTILSAIFLPLNLMVGFFGMNTGSLPFTGEEGTFKVGVLLGTTFVTLFLFLILRKSR